MSGVKILLNTNYGKDPWVTSICATAVRTTADHTLARAITTVERTTGTTITDAYVDNGYRDHDSSGEATIHRAGTSKRKLTRSQKKRRKRRSAVEPKIGHLKSDNRMSRCFLNGPTGDAINAVLTAAGSNFLKLLRRLSPVQIQRLSHANEKLVFQKTIHRIQQAPV